MFAVFPEFENQLHGIYNSSSFNPSAEFLIYYRHNISVENTSLYELISALNKYLIYKAVIVDHEINETRIKVFVLKIELQGPELCLNHNILYPAGDCLSREKMSNLRNLLELRIPKHFGNCTIQGIAMRYEPFVINKNEGIEMELLEELSKKLNVSFDIDVTMVSEDWGDNVNGSWQGNFAKIVNSLMIGIGNVAPESDRIKDFDFTYSYISAKLIWVVPIAKYMKKWRVLTIIFPLDLWELIGSVVALIALLFILSSRVVEDKAYFKEISGGLLSSLQIMINSAVFTTPKTDLVRFIFATGLIFALIITCIYSSSLINVLTSIIREHQIDDTDEILESGLQIGGLEEYRERFQNFENDECADEICKRFEYFQGENDSAQVWLGRVENGLACTPLTRLFVQYYMIKTYEDGKNTASEDSLYEQSQRVKLYIIEKPISFYPLAIVMKKGSPYRRIFNKFLKKFVEAGLINRVVAKYWDQYKKLMNLIQHADDGPEKLSIYHLQGPFSLLGLGCLVAIFVFLIEISLHRKDEKPKKKRTNKTELFNIQKRQFYYDIKLGNMYGKTYSSYLSRHYFHVISKNKSESEELGTEVSPRI